VYPGSILPNKGNGNQIYLQGSRKSVFLNTSLLRGFRVHSALNSGRLDSAEVTDKSHPLPPHFLKPIGSSTCPCWLALETHPKLVSVYVIGTSHIVRCPFQHWHITPELTVRAVVCGFNGVRSVVSRCFRYQV